MVTFSNFTILWVSKLQTKIDLYTLHYECVALSYFIIALLPLKILIKEAIDNLGIYSEKLKFLLKSNVYEDNNGAIVFAKSPGINPTPNHISVKYHRFRYHYGKEFLILKIKS